MITLSNFDTYYLKIEDNHLYLSILDEQLANKDHFSEVIRFTETELEQFIENLIVKLTELRFYK